MLKSQEIINGLQAIVDDYVVFAIVWHLLFYGLIGALFAKWKPSNKLIALLLCLPLASVSLFALLAGNPFNGTVFAILVILIMVSARKIINQPIKYAHWPFIVTGVFMILFGLVYPHFISAGNLITYFYASPVGLIPCPTLSVIIGFVLLINGLGSNTIVAILTIAGLFYGVFGVFKLGVYLDLFLVFGSLSLFAKYIIALFTRHQAG